MQQLAFRRFSDIVTGPDENINLAEAALAIASNEYPDLQTAEYLNILDEMADDVRNKLPQNCPIMQVLSGLNNYMFKELGFSGNLSEFNDPKNSYLNDVLERRLGIPISLSVIYMEIGKRLGMSIMGVSFPGHFLVKFETSDGVVILDPFSGGIILDRQELTKRLSHFSKSQREDMDLQEMLQKVSNKEILARMLRNLKINYMGLGDLNRALETINFLLIIFPDAKDEILERAILHQKLDCFRAASEDYERYLMVCNDKIHVKFVRTQLKKLGLSIARLH